MAQHQRELERQARAAEREQSLARREAERAQRAYERSQAADEKEQKRLYVESRAASVDAKNEELDGYVRSLETLLQATLSVDDFFDLETMKVVPELPPFQPGALGTAGAAPELVSFLPTAPSGLGKFLPGAREKHELAVAEARGAHEAAVVAYREQERVREAALVEAREAHECDVAKIVARAEEDNAEVDELKQQFSDGVPDAIVGYFSLVLDASRFPATFRRRHRIAYVPESKQLVVEFELPGLDAVPAVRQHKYVKARDAIEESARPATQIRALYAQVIAQTALRTVHELFEADRDEKIETVVFNGYVDTIDPATGKPIKPHLVSLRTTRDAFLALDLANVDPLACLKGLNASVSKTPSELVPVRPVLEFDMVDPRFVEVSDVLSSLDQRPNLMELSPKEFESLITNLFEKMGLETRQTQASRDGGVDCVAYDPRPIFGGKVVIQAKRYKHTVGVSAVRDLFGTMQNEGASKGILVSTSGYGKASFEFAQGKPLELLSGTNLLYLLAENAGIEARIEPPDDWVDPAMDVEDAGQPADAVPAVAVNANP
jgi:restriction system protein